MPHIPFTYDDANMRRERVGTKGVSSSEWRKIIPALREAKRDVLKLDANGSQGFLSLPGNKTAIAECEKIVRVVKKTCTDLIVLGIGGSDLGARAMYQAFAGSGANGLRIHFAGSSSDPGQLARILKSVSMKKTAVNVVSKSGGTVETMSAFLILRDRLKKVVGQRFSERIIATTDPKRGVLRDMARTERYHALSIPPNVGGRFSVLSACGLFPAVAMGADADALLAGARACVDAFRTETPNTNAACRYAGLHVIGSKRRGQRIHVVMPYHSAMSEFARWVRQLVAESLGKKTDRRGKTVYEGVTPVAALGPEDQHSQLQLYAEGPFDKLITFIGVRKIGEDLMVPSRDLPKAVSRLGGRKLSALLNAEREATSEALRQVKRPSGTILIDRLDERSMGGLFMFYEIAVALMGELFNVNAFDQPGVELSKKLVAKSLEAGMVPASNRRAR